MRGMGRQESHFPCDPCAMRGVNPVPLRLFDREGVSGKDKLGGNGDDPGIVDGELGSVRLLLRRLEPLDVLGDDGIVVPPASYIKLQV